MAEPYINANALNPGYDYKPSGFLAGMSWDEDRKRYKQQARVQDQMVLEALLRARAENADYNLDAPMRASGRGANIATNRGTEQTAITRAQATLEGLTLGNQTARLGNQTVQQGNEFTSATQPSRIGATNAASVTSQTNSQLTQQQQLIEYLDQAQRGISSMPSHTEQNATWAGIRQSMPPQLQQMLPSAWGPEAITVLAKLKESLSQTAPNMAASRLQTQKDEAEMARTKETTSTQRYGYDRSYQRATEVAQTNAKAKEGAKATLNQRLSEAINQAHTASTPEARTAAGALAQSLIQGIRSLDALDIQSMMDPTSIQRIVEAATRPAPMSPGAPRPQPQGQPGASPQTRKYDAQGNSLP